ncbi:MAG: aldehyde dehydrogenase family protein, partial [Burkholderiaceae bacterium]
MTSADTPPIDPSVARLVQRARAAQHLANDYDQARIDELVAAAGWAIMEPGRNRALAEMAVADTHIGNVEDKIRKNHRKTLGLLRDLRGTRTVGVISEDTARGLVEIARPVGVVAAITPSTNPAATPANKIINALKGRNAVIVAPSPKGWSTCARLVEFIHAEFDRIKAPRDLVQLLEAPISKASTQALMRACDLVVATGSQNNVRAAYASGTPAFGVGAGNVAGIVDETADVAAAADRIVRSKTFDNATSCSSENSLVLIDAVRDAVLDALRERGAVLLDATQKTALQRLMWPDGKLSSQVIGQSARAIAQQAEALDPADAARWRDIAARTPSILLVDEDDIGDDHPFSGVKLSPVLALYRAADFDAAMRTVGRIYAYMGAGNVAGIVDETADVAAAADRIVRSKTFDNATSCSSEN